MAKKRGFTGDPVTETHEHLRNEMSEALAVVPKLKEPELPAVSEVSDLGDEELQQLLEATDALRGQSMSCLEACETYRQHLKASMDAVMLLLSIRGSSSESKKRRRTAVPYQSILSIGLPVVAKFEGTWLGGEISTLGSEYTIVSESRTWTAKERDIIAVQNPAPVLNVGAQVLALRGEEYLPAEVVSQRGQKVRVMYLEDEDEFRETELDRSQVVPRPVNS